METMLMQVQSLSIVLLLILGIVFKRNLKLHVRTMSLAISWDILLILQIELSRSAILKATKAASNPIALNIHVTIAVITVIFYAIMIFTGRKLLKKEIKFKPRHRLFGYSTLILRVLTLVTSFWAVTPKE